MYYTDITSTWYKEYKTEEEARIAYTVAIANNEKYAEYGRVENKDGFDELIPIEVHC